MTPEQIARARWVQNSPTTMILKCCIKDGGAVLATITQNWSLWHWRLADGSANGAEPNGYTARREVHAALKVRLK